MIYFILVLAAVLRLILVNQSFWLDEAASLIIARQDLTQLISSLAGDFHPPLYYLFMHFWLKIGLTQEWFLRLPNILFSVAAIYLLYLLFKKALGNKMPKLVIGPVKLSLPATAALFLALNPLHIYYSQELRMFAPAAFLVTASWYFLVSAQKSNKNSWFILWALTNTLGLYTYYLSGFNILSQLIYLLLADKKLLKKLLPWTFLTALSFLPWLPTFIKQTQGGQYLVEALPNWSQLSGDLSLKNIALIPVKFILGRVNISSDDFYLLAIIASLLYTFSLMALSLFQKLSRLFWLWLVVPLLIGVALSFKIPMLGYWRYLFLLPAFSSLLAIGIFHLPAKLSMVNILLLSITFLFSNFLFWTTPSFHRENWKQATDFVLQKQDQQSVSVFAFPQPFAPVRWYAPQLNSSGALTDLSIDPQELDLNLSQITTGKDTVYYFEYLSELTDPKDNIPAWLNNAGYNQEQIYNFNGVGFVYQYQH